ncbi:hypothetical protein Tco_1263055 [Tanacetum coccineum]
MEVSRLSEMDNDLFTYKVEVANIPCNSVMDDDLEDETDDDMGYDPSDGAFIEWLRSKNFNYKMMDQYTMKDLWIYWIRGDDEVEITDEESSDDEDEIADVFRIDTNIINYETPICSAFNEFNYLLKVDSDLLTKDIIGFKTYDDYKNDWINEWNKDVPWVDEKPRTDTGVWAEPKLVKHTYEPFNYKTGCSEWPTYSWKENDYYDCELKDEALRNKAIMDGVINDDESCCELKRKWNIYTYYDDAYEINHEDNRNKELCEIHEPPVCNIKKYIMIKYSFNDDEEYVAVKEDEYDDLIITRRYAFQTYQEIFRIMDEGWMISFRLRIESYIQLQDYALWEIIEDGNSFKPVARTTTNADGTSTSTIPGAVTAEEKIQKKNDLKARSILMMTLPSEHLLTFNQYKDAKTLFEAIEARFGGNEATKKTQKTLLKQMYENFNASSSESLDSIFTRIQKIISQIAILGENISQEDQNFKLLRILPSEWSMHVVVWRNKPASGSISFDDLYNNFKIVEQEVKRSVTSSSNSNSQNVAFVSTPSSTNDVNTSNVLVNNASSSLSTASSTDNTARLSDATIYAFLANQLNGSQVVHEDLEQIHKDDLKEIDLKWQLALISMKARKFYQRTRKKIIVNGSDTAECKNPRSQENRSRNQDSSRRTVNVEESSSKAMLAIDGAGVDWSYMTEEEVPTNFALMAFSDSEVLNNKTCSKTCLKSFEDLKSQYDNLRIELNKFKSDLANCKRGLASVEEQLVFYKKNEERLTKEKESNQIKIGNFENASKSLDKLIGSQISKNNRNGVGYNAVATPPTGLFAPPTIDLSNSGLEEFKQPEFKGYGVKVKKIISENSSNDIKKTYVAPIIEDWVSDSDEDETMENVSESANVQQPKQADHPRKVSQNPRNNSTNGNTPMSKKLGVGFQFTPKACFVCGSFNHPIKDFLTKSGLVPISTDRPIKTAAPKPFVNVAKSRPNAFQKSHSPSRRPFYQQTALKNRNLNNKVNTVKFWQTTTVETVNDGEQQITVTVDGHKFAITEASVRRHLQLANVDGLSSLPNTEIFEQLSLMGTMLLHDQPGQGDGPTVSVEFQQTPIDSSSSTSQPTTS